MDIFMEYSMNFKVAMFYAHWKNFGEPWCTPQGVETELLSRGYEVKVYNLYHADGDFLPKQKLRTYSSDCFNKFSHDYRLGYRPDMVLVMDYGPFDCIQMDKQYYPGIPFVLEAGDTPQSIYHHAQKAHKFDIVFTPDYNSAKALSNGHWLTHWADQRVFYPRNIVPTLDVVSTCGGRKYTEEIQKVLGSSFNNERYFFGNAHAERLSMGKIVFQNSQFGEITRRIFEGMACHKMVLTDRLSKETKIDDLFIDGIDIVYYDNAQDAIEKAKYYLSHDEKREAIARNGYNKVMDSHTVSKRVDQLMELLNATQNR